jgi:dTDP-4-dehydrorhamnose 3,5-epimerase
MIFHETPLPGAFLVEPVRFEDERGFFARTWCEREFAERRLLTRWVQCNISFNHRKGTLRGIHYQLPPSAEDKLVRVTTGAIFDVIVDLRPDSATFLQWHGVELTAENRLALFVPTGFAHGFQTLDDGCEVFYQMSAFYAPDMARGLSWDDPLIGVEWPLPVAAISERDRSYPFADSKDFALLRSDVLEP